jgi:hypothetical protein
LKVSTKALFGKKNQIEKHIQKLGIGRKINTSHTERLNGTIRGQQTRLARRTRNGSHLEIMLQYSVWLWRDHLSLSSSAGSAPGAEMPLRCRSEPSSL